MSEAARDLARCPEPKPVFIGLMCFGALLGILANSGLRGVIERFIFGESPWWSRGMGSTFSWEAIITSGIAEGAAFGICVAITRWWWARALAYPFLKLACTAGQMWLLDHLLETATSGGLPLPLASPIRLLECSAFMIAFELYMREKIPGLTRERWKRGLAYFLAYGLLAGLLLFAAEQGHSAPDAAPFWGVVGLV